MSNEETITKAAQCITQGDFMGAMEIFEEHINSNREDPASADFTDNIIYRHHAPLWAKMVTRGAGTGPSPAAQLQLFAGETMCGLATELSLPGGGLSLASTARHLDGLLGAAGFDSLECSSRFSRSRLSRTSHSSITTCESNYLNDRCVVNWRKRGKTIIKRRQQPF